MTRLRSYRHGPCSSAGSDLTGIFVKGGIAHPVQPVFDTPMTPDQCGQLGWVGYAGRE